MKDSHYIVIVSDLHAGSSVALCPSRFRCDDGQIVETSDIQKCIYAHWQIFWDEFVPMATNDEPYTVVVNGDVVEGQHHRSAQYMSVNEEDHEKIAVELLRPVREKAKGGFYMVRGTEAHVGPSAGHEESVARELETDMLDPEADTHTFWELWFEFGPHLCHFAHHIGVTSSTAYELSALSRELAGNLIEAAQWGDRPADVIVRSHRHRYSSGEIPMRGHTAQIIVTPAWQARTAFVFKKVSMRRPQFGGVVLGYDKFGLFKRCYIWGLPRQGKIPLTKRAAEKSLISTGASSSPRSRPKRAAKKSAGKRRRK